MAATFTYLLFLGPTEVLLPYLVKNELGGDARDFGLILAAGGVSALAAAFLIGQTGLPRRVDDVHLPGLGGRDPRASQATAWRTRGGRR